MKPAADKAEALTKKVKKRTNLAMGGGLIGAGGIGYGLYQRKKNMNSDGLPIQTQDSYQ